MFPSFERASEPHSMRNVQVMPETWHTVGPSNVGLGVLSLVRDECEESPRDCNMFVIAAVLLSVEPPNR